MNKYNNMMKFYILLSLQLLMAMDMFSQKILIKGKMAPSLEKETPYLYNSYIPYVKIYMNSSTINKINPSINIKYIENITNTSSDINGEFSIEIPTKYYEDSLVFEHWAFKIKKMSINKLLHYKPSVIYLEDEIILMPALRVKSYRRNKLLNNLINKPQYTKHKKNEQKIYYPIPVFPGGNREFNLYITKRIKQERIKIKKPLIVEFTITKRGTIEGIEVLSKNNKETNNKIELIFKQSPKWKPGRARGSKIKCIFALPIIFDSRKRNNK